MDTKPTYRPDIDGLRAIAVLSVVLYHYGASWLPGGFTGVDVFFVISGYLITTILKRDIENRQFSLLSFYDRRVRRILPALMVMLSFTLAVGWFLLMPGDYADLGGSAAAAAFGFGNLFFFWNTGYFDQAAELQPLLHTWSLGVEEQFYFVWPVVLWFGLSLVRSKKLFLWLFAVALALAFAYAVRKVGNEPKAAFYLPAPRAWELGIGAFMAFIPSIRSRVLGEAVGFAGLGLVGWSLLAISSEDTFPGVNALFSCVGTAMLVWPRPDGLVSRALSLRPAVAVGLISYSLYLWHWPVLVLYRHYANASFPSGSEVIALFGLSIVLGYLSWRFVERPFRKPMSSRAKSVLVGLAAAGVLAAPASAVHAYSGIEARIPDSARGMDSLDAMWEWDCRYEPIDQLDGTYCVFGAPWNEANSWGMVWGDSHAEHTAPLLEAVAIEQQMAFVLFRDCPPALGGQVQRVRSDIPDYVPHCAASRENAISALADTRFKVLVLASSWNPLARSVSSTTLQGGGTELVSLGIDELLAEIERSDLRTILVDQMPNFTVDPVACHLAEALPLPRKAKGCQNLNENGF